MQALLLSSLALEGAIAALKDVDFVEKTVQLVKEERAYVLDGLRKIGIEFWPTQGNFVMIRPPVPDTELVPKLEKKGIMVRPVGNFGAPGMVRISFGKREANKAVLEALSTIVKEKPLIA